MFKEGDFILTNSMSFGRPYILKTDRCIYEGGLIIRDTESIFSQDFLYYTLSSEFAYKSFCELAVESSVKNLQLDTVKSVFLPILPYAEQIHIAEEMYSLINLLEKSLS